ncbi:hypothetical protein E4U42_002298 [Claviceps africana]|uniref:Major facilitator superfamily (MFS) profile domain-containing protein n=1 Tax=Claviceps africana TaxID=83212 RepID=A0A8K0J872_9HYPO|nr:hypothetical protein E4U42_002298 [Claviceps africana]
MSQAPRDDAGAVPNSSHSLHPIRTRHGATSETGVAAEVDGPANKRLLRKIDWKLMPVLSATYALQAYGKAVLGHAFVYGLAKDLGIEGGLKYSWALLSFYFGYIAGTYPISLLAQLYRPRVVIITIFSMWAFAIITSPAITSYSGLLVNRFFLGFIGSGVSPIFMLVIGL